jgi:hypothetical protein
MLIYAFGFQLNLTQLKLQKTGIFTVVTEPSGAKIYIDGDLQINPFKFYSQTEHYVKTPSKLKNIIPGEHDIRIELDGYWPWEKKLTINPGETVFAENIRLFVKKLPLMMLPVNKQDFEIAQISPDKQELALIANDQLTILNLKKETTTANVKLMRSGIETITWSPNNKFVLIGTTIFDINKQSLLNLNEYTGNTPTNLKWSVDSDTIYYQNNSNIYTFTISNQAVKKIITAKIDDYLIKDNSLYYLATNSQDTVLHIYDLGSQKDKGQINLAHGNYRFINPDNTYLNLYNADLEKLTLIEILSPLAEKYNHKEINNFKQGFWSKDQLFYSNDFEISVWDSRDNSNTILTRLSGKILDVLWHPSNNHLIYRTATAVTVLELDKRDQHNTTLLTTLNNINYVALNQDGTLLYIFGDIGNRSGLYRLEL